MGKTLKQWMAICGAIVIAGSAAAVLQEWRFWVTPNELYTVASELEKKVGKEKARSIVRDAEDDERYWEQKVKSGMWHEPASGSASKKFWLEDQKKARSNRSYFEQKVRDLKK